MDKAETDKMHSAEDLRLLKDKIKQANDGEESAVAWIKDFLDDNPQVWQTVGDLSVTSERTWIALVSGGDVLATESVRRQLSQLKSELIGELPQPVEKMLGDQIVATWLEVQYLETLTADQRASSAQTGTMLKRMESAQKRHLNAIRSLVQIRRLLPAYGTRPILRLFPGEREVG